MPEPEISIETEAEPKPVEVVVEDDVKGDDSKGLEPKEHEPPPEHPRFKQIYGKLKASERELERLKGSSEANDRLIQEMRDHNIALQEAVNKLSDTKDETVKRDLKNIHEGLLKEKRQAFEEGNYDKLVDIDERLFELKVAMKTKPEKVVKEKPAPAAIKIDGSKDKDIADFKASAEWFDSDDMMTGAAIEMEKALLVKYKGSKAYSEVLKEVKSEVEKRFKYESPKDEEEDEMHQSVEGGSNISGKAKPNSVKMSRDEMEVAAKLGVKPEDFAKQKILMEKVKK